MSKRRKDIEALEPVIVREYEAGLTINKLAIKYGCCNTTIHRILSKRMVEIRAGRTTKEQEREIVHRYVVDQAPSTRIAKDMGFSLIVVLRVLRQNDIEPSRRPDKMKADMLAKGAKMLEEGATSRQIAEALGVSASLVSKYFRRESKKSIHRNELKGLKSSLEAFIKSDRCKDRAKAQRQIAALEYFI